MNMKMMMENASLEEKRDYMQPCTHYSADSKSVCLHLLKKIRFCLGQT